MTEKSLTTFEIAHYCQVSHRTVQQWILVGKLPSHRTPGNHNRIKNNDFLEFLKKYNMPIPEDFQKMINLKKRILIVDDDRDMVELMKDSINSQNQYDIEEACDGFSAGKKFSEFQPDLMILDLMLPKVDGIEVLKDIRRDSKNKDVKIILISGIIRKEESKHLMELGADDFLSKPFNRRQLVEKVEKQLAVRKY